ncbi:Sorting nexin 1 [Diplonema papillatum]|nr:Sorting nexin 1 [Diplonema papillatum]|eukprot:gene1941-2950_t
MSGNEVATVPAGSYYEFNVADPQKKEKGGALDLAYWTYQIYTKTNLVSNGLFKQASMRAVRRYNDFVWLREVLVDEHPGVICPPIPEKSIKGSIEKVAGSQGSSPLREYRQRAMRKFLVRVGAHPQLYCSQSFVSFLELEEEADFMKLTKQPRKKVEVDLNASEKMMQMKSSVFGNKPKNAEEASWEETRQYVAQLENSLNMLKERVELLVKRRRETGTSLNEFGKAFKKVGDVERSYEEGPLSTALVDVGHHSEHLALVYGEQADTETIQVVETIGYYIGMCGAIKDVIKRLQRMASTRDILEQSLAHMNEEKTAAETAGKDQKVRTLESDIQVTTANFEKARTLAENAANSFADELRRFHREKQYDIKQMLKSFVELQLEYANKMKKSWETLLPSVEAIRVD